MDPIFRPMGGALCSGDGLEVMPCKLPLCAPAKDHRQDACDSWALNGYSGSTGTRTYSYSRNTSPTVKYYAAPPPSDKACSLHCYKTRRNQAPQLISTGRNVPTGTPCSYDDPHSFCLMGICYNIGCDHTIDSGKRYNDCGICGGSVEDCNYIKIPKKKANSKIGSKS